MAWYKLINPIQEFDLLHKRINKVDTPLSSFHYIINGIPQYIYNENQYSSALGIVISADSNRIVYWNNSLHNDISEGLFEDVVSQKNYFIIKSEDSLRKELIDYYNSRNTALSQTEGLFRHYPKDIRVISLEPSINGEYDYKAAYYFAKLLETKFHVSKFSVFYKHNLNLENFEPISRREIKAHALEKKNVIYSDLSASSIDTIKL